MDSHVSPGAVYSSCEMWKLAVPEANLRSEITDQTLEGVSRSGLEHRLEEEASCAKVQIRRSGPRYSAPAAQLRLCMI